MGRMSGRTLGFLLAVGLAMSAVGAASAVTRGDALNGPCGCESLHATETPVAAKAPGVSFSTDIKVLPNDGIGLVFQSFKAKGGTGPGYSLKLRLGGVDLEWGTGG